MISSTRTPRFLAVRALATDQLSGNAPRISAVVIANTDNPAEICKQILLDSGVDKEKIMPSFEEWGKFLQRKRLYLQYRIR